MQRSDDVAPLQRRSFHGVDVLLRSDITSLAPLCMQCSPTTFLGELKGQALSAAYASADIFVMPRCFTRQWGHEVLL